MCIALTSIVLTGCKSTEEKAADAALVSNCELNTYKNYQEILEGNPNKIASLTPQYTYYKGSSLLPFGSRQIAVDEAKLYVCKKNLKDALVVTDREKTYSAQEKAIGGVYHIYHLMPFSLTDINEEELISQLKLWVPSEDYRFANPHRDYLLKLARNKEFTNLTPTLEKLVKTAEAYTNSYSSTLLNSQKLNYLISLHKQIVDLYVFHKGNIAEDKLVVWVKYHKQKTIKLASYQGLITLGKLTVVEELLANEDDADLKKML
jgi:hypothetical protein